MQVFYGILIFCAGLSFGSFLNALVWRTRQNIKITHGRSMCPSCHRRLAWFENIPVFSFLFLKGRCGVCKHKIHWQYLVVETVMGALFLAVALLTGSTTNLLTPEVVRDWVVVFNLAFIFLYDLNYGEILDSATIPSSIVLFAFSAAMGWHTWQSMAVGIAVGAGLFLAQYALSKGKWIGGGDIRLGLLMGVILGWPNILVALFLAYVGGAAINIILVGLKKRELSGITPFGTYLSAATLVAMLGGGRIVEWYLGTLR